MTKNIKKQRFIPSRNRGKYNVLRYFNSATAIERRLHLLYISKKYVFAIANADKVLYNVRVHMIENPTKRRKSR